MSGPKLKLVHFSREESYTEFVVFIILNIAQK